MADVRGAWENELVFGDGIPQYIHVFAFVGKRALAEKETFKCCHSEAPIIDLPAVALPIDDLRRWRRRLNDID